MTFSLRSHFTLLPAELLLLIFDFSLSPLSCDDSWHVEPSAIQDAESYRRLCLAIASTCARFRHLITSTHKFWTNVVIPIKGDTFDAEEMANLLLARSAPRQFDLTLSFSNWTGGDLPELKEILAVHMPRCRSLNLFCREPSEQPNLKLLDGIDFPSLRCLKVEQFGDCDDAAQNEFDCLDPLDMPLTALSIIRSDSGGPLYFPTLSIPFDTLTRLEVEGWVDVWVPSLLPEFHQLEHLRWYSLMSELEGEVTPEHIYLPNLLSLCLEYDAISVFPLLDAPRLEQIVLIEDDFRNWSEDVPNFLASDTATFPSLRRFACSFTHLTEDFMKSFVRRHALLNEISIVDTFTGDFDIPGQLVRAITKQWAKVSQRRASIGDGGGDLDKGTASRTFHLELAAHWKLKWDFFEYGAPQSVFPSLAKALRSIPGLHVRIAAGAPGPDVLPKPLAKFSGSDRFIISEESRREAWPNAWRSWYAMYRPVNE